MKMYAMVVKESDDKYGWLENVAYIVESRIVEKKYTRQDGVTWEELVTQAEKEHGKENVRVEQVEILSNCAEDVAAFNLELYEKLPLNQHTIPVKN